jgi:hypothetical protein
VIAKSVEMKDPLAVIVAVVVEDAEMVAEDEFN